MTEIHEAVRDIKSLAKQYRSVLKVAEVLENIGNIENVRREAEAATEHARRNAVAAVENAKKQQAELAAVQMDAANIRESNKHLLVDARKHRQTLLLNAGKEAEQIVSEAQSRAKAIDKKLREVEQAHAKVMGDYAIKADAAQAKLDEIEVELAAVRERIGQKEG